MNHLLLIEKVLYHIDEYIHEELTYERLAEGFGYSSFHFHKFFSSVTELSITAREKHAKISYRSVEEIVTGYLKRVAIKGVFSMEPHFEEFDLNIMMNIGIVSLDQHKWKSIYR